MCYSALVNRSLKAIAARHRAKIRDQAFVDLYTMRCKNPALKIPPGMDQGAIEIGGMAGKSIEKNIREFNRNEEQRTNQLLQDVNPEIAEIENRLKVIVTKTAEKELAVKRRKREKLLTRSTEEPSGVNYRIYPFYFAPVVIDEGSGREIVPMRFRVLPRYGIEIPANKNVFNARRDSLQVKRTWTPLFGATHALFPFERFYEWVLRDEKKIEISFSPDGYSDMWAASVYESCKTEFGVLQSFAMCTDDPPAEVARAGHDRCPVFLIEELIDQWLQPKGKTWDELDGLLEKKQPTHYSHVEVAKVA